MDRKPARPTGFVTGSKSLSFKEETMKRAIILATVMVLVLSSAVLPNDEDGLAAAERSRKIYVRFRTPPPSFYYVPNRIILHLRDEVAEAYTPEEIAAASTT
jgi:hypothetical protein